jgi:hypothetical protein
LVPGTDGLRKKKWRVAGVVPSEIRSEVDFVRSVLLVEGWLRGLNKEEPAPDPLTL